MRSHILAVAAILTVGVGSAPAAFKVQYDFSDTEYNGANTRVPGSVLQDGGVTAQDITIGSGLTAVPTSDALNTSGWSTGSSIGATDYYTFTIQANPNLTFSLNSLAFGDQRSSGGPNQFSIRTDLNGDNFTTELFHYTLNDENVHNEAFTFNPIVFSGLTSIEIRIYGYGATSAAGTYALNDGTAINAEPPGGLILSGNTQPAGGGPNAVPVPPSAVMLLSGAPALLLLRRRWVG